MRISESFRAMRRTSWLRQFFVYGLVGGIATLLDWGTFYLTNNLLGFHYIVCTIVSIFFGSGTNFILNRLITFKSKSKRVGIQLVAYCLVSAVSIFLSVGWMYLFVEVIGLVPLIARMTTTCIMYAINFLLVKFFVFSPRTVWSG